MDKGVAIYIYIQGVSSLRSLPPKNLGGIINFCSKHTSNNLQRLRTRTRMRIFIRPQATPPIDIEGCGLRDQRCCNVHPASFNQLAKETRYSRGSFVCNSSRQKTPTTESPPSVKQSRTTSNPERCSFVAFEPLKVSLPVDLHFLPHASNAPSLVSRLTLRLSMSIDNRTSNQTLALKRKKMFIARVEWLPVTSRSHVTDGHHRQTDKCKLSIMIAIGRKFKGEKGA